MKKRLFSAVFIAAILTVQAQETVTETVRQNDVMISPIELIAIPILNISYERLLNENSGIGINGIFYLGNNIDSSENGLSQISPYYRMYFGKKYASGFFVEGFVPVTMTKDTYHESYYSTGYNSANPPKDNNTTVGLGVGFGGKWVARKNIIFEASTGIARRFGIDQKYDAAVTAKGMLGIGYRF